MSLEFEAAVARFDADLIIAASASPTAPGADHLRRRAVAVYRNALNFAAGHPLDRRWSILALIVDAFIRCIGSAPHAPQAQAALERLVLLCDEGSSKTRKHTGHGKHFNYQPADQRAIARR